MRAFDDVIFFGNDGCTGQMQVLHLRLERGAEIAQGLQQPMMSTDPEPTPEDEAYELQLKNELRDVVRDVAMALAGEDILFVGRVR